MAIYEGLLQTAQKAATTSQDTATEVNTQGLPPYPER